MKLPGNLNRIQKIPEIIDKIKKLMQNETAGNPMSGLKWTKKTTQKIADELNWLGIKVSKNTVGMLLKEMKYSLRANSKKNSNGEKKLSAKEKKDRDKQFIYINNLRNAFATRNNAVISVDTKKKELIGNFKNPGKVWGNKEECVNDHDFASYAIGKAIPYSIYNTNLNRGTVFVGTTYDTPNFAVDCIEKWWLKEGYILNPTSKKVLILADGGGSNSSRSRVWKHDIQEKLCDRHGLSITVCHYPPGASKWNPVEHRLHSEISKNWAGKPLNSYETVLKYLRKTKTSTGLKVNAHFVRQHYKLGQKATDEQMASISIARHDTFPNWNYTIRPR